MVSFGQIWIVTAVLFTRANTATGRAHLSFLTQAAFRSQAASSFLLRAQRNNDPVTRTFQTLDTNHNGYVDPTEVTLFATSQGLDAASASKEFATLDANGDGTLDASELSNALGVETPTSVATGTSAQIQPVATQAQPASMQAQPVATQAQPVVMQAPPVALSAPAAESLSSAQPMAAQVNSQALSIQASQNQVAAQSAAIKIVEQISLETRDEEQAQELDRQVAEFRANSTTMSKVAVQSAMKAASEAANRTASQVLQALLKLEQQAKQAEVEAAGLRAKAKAELIQANEFMAIAGVALQQEPHSTM